jgi:hypothetical protein
VSYFAVIREAGPAWAAGGIFQQPSVTEHAAFMNALTEQASSSSAAHSPEPKKAASVCC